MYEMKRLLYEMRAADYNNDPVSSLVPTIVSSSNNWITRCVIVEK